MPLLHPGEKFPQLSLSLLDGATFTVPDAFVTYGFDCLTLTVVLVGSQ